MTNDIINTPCAYDYCNIVYEQIAPQAKSDAQMDLASQQFGFVLAILTALIVVFQLIAVSQLHVFIAYNLLAM